MPVSLVDRLLVRFPSHTHALTLAADPDRLLQQPALHTSLAAQGFRLIEAGDPIALRQAWCAAVPVTPEQPVIVVTRAPANTLPYDLWQQGVAVDLSLPHLFPQLDPALLADLTLPQLDRIDKALERQPLAALLSHSATLDYVLLHAFGAAPHQLATPGPLLRWLADLYAEDETLPAPLRTALVALLQHKPALAAWPLAGILADRAVFAAFAQEQWHAWVRHLGESGVPYAGAIPFPSDPAVQAALPLLVNRGVLTSVAVAEGASFPPWSHAALHEDRALATRQRWDTTVGELEHLLTAGPADWQDWQDVAGRWADLTVQRFAAAPVDEGWAGRYASLADRLAPRYAAWLQTGGYARLANRRLPAPHHVHHIPWVLSQDVAGGRRIALLVLDGMSLAAWRMIWAAWAARHPAWRVHERLVLAQVPTITAVSRQALLAGQPPRAFAASLAHNQQEEAHWRRFWSERNLSAHATAYAAIAPKQHRPQPSALDSLQTRALAVVLPDIDAMVHGATDGLAALYAGLKVWLNTDEAAWGSRWLESLIDTLLAHGYKVSLTSDHGHVAARGMGQPQEGVVVTTRSKRARLYPHETFARHVQASFAQTTLWYDDGLLPNNIWVLMPHHGAAFAPAGQLVVSHGGITLDETIVPFIEIEQEHG